MIHFANTFASRKIALTMLAIWLFGLASGLANACLLEAPGTHSRGTPTEASGNAHAPAHSADHAGPSVGAHDDRDPSKAPCVKACDDSVQALQKLNAGADPGDPGPASVVAILWSASTPVTSASRRIADRQPSLADPPIRVRYSRWTS